MTVTIKPNNKCNNCQHYQDQHCAVRSVPRFCGKRYLPVVSSTAGEPSGDAAPSKSKSSRRPATRDG